MSGCDACVGVEAEHHLCDECVQDDIEATRALRAERDAALALADATQAELNAEREQHHATAGRVERLRDLIAELLPYCVGRLPVGTASRAIDESTRNKEVTP